MPSELCVSVDVVRAERKLLSRPARSRRSHTRRARHTRTHGPRSRRATKRTRQACTPHGVVAAHSQASERSRRLPGVRWSLCLSATDPRCASGVVLLISVAFFGGFKHKFGDYLDY
eukprot:6979038-Prymnesium_polylepis.2